MSDKMYSTGWCKTWSFSGLETAWSETVMDEDAAFFQALASGTYTVNRGGIQWPVHGDSDD